MSVTFDQTTILLIICSGIMGIMFMLIGAVICFYVKIFQALKASKECGPQANSANNTEDKVILAETAAVDSCSTFQFCDESKMYADYDPLSSSFCDINEGL
ncbi:Protein FAM24A [Heterocephalus glaber]|uniref:Protein FAM24A n=1 Tax=Heterocephalus glaber TaxID=10181 RepID=G5C696_HETGA|nr:Protein FAM24A [Heterocephalus glaber]